jgi:diguanylate cyclase (GGDEF)-like protein
VQVYEELEQRVRDRTADLEKANEEIRRLSLTDELTGLYNRRGFYVLAEPALRAARNHGHDCLLVFLDVDGLKQVNDEGGHDTGDSLITDVAQVLRDVLDQSDILARIGGDEFSALVSEPEGDPTTLRNRLLDAFRSFNEFQERPYRLSVSVGLVHVPAEDAETLDGLMARADRLMYAEKKRKATSGEGSLL